MSVFASDCKNGCAFSMYENIPRCRSPPSLLEDLTNRLQENGGKQYVF